jgi:DNA-binding NarL/FixJ family response regulator
MLSVAPLRVVIIEDHDAVSEMLARFVEALARFKIAGRARDVGAGLELCRSEQPDLIILDLMLSPPEQGPTGLNALPELRTACPRARVLVFSGHLRPAWIRRILASGAYGLVDKTAAGEELLEALRALAEGRIYYSRHASEEIRKMVHRRPAQVAALGELTEREIHILKAIAEGLSSKEISARFGISLHTVVNHRCRLSKKTGRRGAARLARYATELGLVEEAWMAPGAIA